VGIEIGVKKVGGGKLGAFLEEQQGTGLEHQVGDTMVEEVKGKGGGDEIGAANGLAKVASPTGKLGVGGKNDV
jgi:hypothetical protein